MSLVLHPDADLQTTLTGEGAHQGGFRLQDVKGDTKLMKFVKKLGSASDLGNIRAKSRLLSSLPFTSTALMTCHGIESRLRMATGYTSGLGALSGHALVSTLDR